MSRELGIMNDSKEQTRYARTFAKALRKGRSGAGALLGVSLTGMIDVVFNLLIFFVVITTASQREGFLQGELPGAAAFQGASEVRALPIMITVYAGNRFDDCQVELGGGGESPSSFEELITGLSSLNVARGGLYEANNPVVLNLGAGVSVDQMVKSYNAVVLAGFNNIQFVRNR